MRCFFENGAHFRLIPIGCCALDGLDAERDAVPNMSN
jgi:hypothetical protein